MEKVIGEAEKNIYNLRIIYLGCFANNVVALNLYKELGFMEYSRLPEGIFYKGTYTDSINMFKKIK